jgi:hypothetical protein
MPEEVLKEIKSQLSKVQNSSEDSEASFHLNTARQLIDVALYKTEASREDDSKTPISSDD